HTRFKCDWSSDVCSSDLMFGFGPQDYVIGLCAALRPEKAHGDLLTAVAKLRARGVPAKALLIGDGPQRQGLEQTIRQLGLGEHEIGRASCRDRGEGAVGG